VPRAGLGFCATANRGLITLFLSTNSAVIAFRPAGIGSYLRVWPMRRTICLTGDFDCDVTPLGIQDMKRIVIYVGHECLSLDVIVGSDIPHRRLTAADQG